MALKGYWSEDAQKRSCLVLEKKKGWINQKEVFEWMETHNMRGTSLIHMADCPEEIPEEFYEEGDKWFLYEPEYIIEEVAARAEMTTGYTYKVTKE